MDLDTDVLENVADSHEDFGKMSKTSRYCKCFRYGGICFRTSLIAMAVILYLMIGGAIFVAFEQSAEKARNELVKSAENNLLAVEDQILDLLTNSTMVDVEAAANLTNLLKQLTLQNSTSITKNWNYGSSLFFCTTVITTIGYGNLAPTTTEGQGFFIIYALLGIPLALVLLTVLSTILNNTIDCLWKKLSNHTEKRIVKIFFCVTIGIIGLTLFIFVPSFIFHDLQEWTYFESVYYCIATLTTVGFGDFVPTQDTDNTQNEGIYRVYISGWIWFGLAFVALLIGRVQKLIEGLGKKCNKTCHKCCKSYLKKNPAELNKFDMREYGGTDTNSED